jgi:hypothetical protein
MTKPDDSSLEPSELLAIETRARKLLNEASAWDRFPTPIEDILAAAKVRVAPKGLFDQESFLVFVRHKAVEYGSTLKSALSKVLGLYDANEELIHVDFSVGVQKQSFLKLHETGHHVMPTHRKVFRLFQDCQQTLDPSIADKFEREANNFARFALFQGDTFKCKAADLPMGVKTPVGLARIFGASLYASAREFARTNHRACLVYVLEPIEIIPGRQPTAKVRRVEPSPPFRAQFGCPSDTEIGLGHALGRLLPIGRRMAPPTGLILKDLNGVDHECLGEAMDTKHNIILLIYPVKALK